MTNITGHLIKVFKKFYAIAMDLIKQIWLHRVIQVFSYFMSSKKAIISLFTLACGEDPPVPTDAANDKVTVVQPTMDKVGTVLVYNCSEDGYYFELSAVKNIQL